MAPLIYVINLDRDTERLASIRANLGALGLGFERLPAVMGKDVPDWEKLVDLAAYAWRNRMDTPLPVKSAAPSAISRPWKPSSGPKRRGA